MHHIASSFVSIPKWCDYKPTQKQRIMEWSQFQFQNGAIISIYVIFTCIHTTEVSIPKWCDYKIIFDDDRAPSTRVSIPKWCDYKRYPKWWRLFIRKVSIPKWCDYKPVMSAENPVHGLFQFQNGAIISTTWTAISKRNICFNSKMVRL